MIMYTSFGNAMRSIREERKMTLEEMAALLGTTKQALSRYERCERTPKITIAAKFAEKLNVPLEDLIGYEYHDSDPVAFVDSSPKTPEARLLAKGIDKMPQAQREAIVTMMTGLYPGLFEEGNENDDT